jgi:hypothetical protein
LYNNPGAIAGIPDSADIVMKLSIKGEYIYGIERTTFAERQLVRRSIQQGFLKTDSIVLGTDTKLSNLSYCIDDSTLYLQGTDTLTAYSLDLRSIKWKRSIPHRTLFHTYIQGIERNYNPGLKNMTHQSIACDKQYLYNVSDSHLVVIDSKDGTTLLDHLFTDLPYRSCSAYVPRPKYLGPAGTVTLLPDYVVVNSAYVGERMWVFKKISTGASKAPFQLSPGILSINLSPNPSRPGITITANLGNDKNVTQNVRVEFFDVRGAQRGIMLVTPSAISTGIVWHRDNLPAGLYCVRVSYNGQRISKQFTLVN